MRGAYGDSGMLGLPLSFGDPGPDMPETLYLLPGDPEGRLGRDEPAWCWPVDSLSCVLKAGSDSCASDGGVTEPLEGAVPWLTAPSLEVSVELSVRKLAFDRRRSSFKNAMVTGDSVRPESWGPLIAEPESEAENGDHLPATAVETA